MNIVELNKEEATEAAIMGIHRRMTNLYGELKDLGHHGPPIGGSWWSNDIEAAGAELAFSKFINEKWVGAVNTFNAPDVEGGWQVRYTDWDNGCLILRKKDEPKLNQKFVLVTGSMPKYHIRGYIVGKNGVRKKYLKNPHGGKPALFIPQSDLIKFENEKTH
jgi:hypothetical protein